MLQGSPVKLLVKLIYLLLQRLDGAGLGGELAQHERHYARVSRIPAGLRLEHGKEHPSKHALRPHHQLSAQAPMGFDRERGQIVGSMKMSHITRHGMP
jgi:hypothetical protein